MGWFMIELFFVLVAIAFAVAWIWGLLIHRKSQPAGKSWDEIMYEKEKREWLEIYGDNFMADDPIGRDEARAEYTRRYVEMADMRKQVYNEGFC